MIPLTLSIKNFLSYGPQTQTINFGPYPLICLSGKNGHGKSALLDAITWALWGQARKVGSAAKADEGLLRLGQTQMMVSLDFTSNGQTYRVRREFAVTYGKPYAALDFGILDQATEQVVSLTDKTIRATQEKIEATVGLDFDAFINSAFLRQGQSNEFSKKSPKERKEILASIIGLDRFEQLRKRSLEKAKEAINEQELLLSLQNRIVQELEQSQTITTQLALLQETLLRISEQENSLQKQHIALAQEKTGLAQQQHAAQLLTYQLTSKEQEYGALHAKLTTLRTAWKEVHRQQLRLTDMQAGEEEKKNKKGEVAQHQDRLQKNLAIKESLLKNQATAQTMLQKLQAEHAVVLNEKKLLVERLQQQHALLNAKMQDEQKQLAELGKEVIAVSDEYKKSVGLAQAEEYKKLIAQEEKQFEKRKNYYQRYIAQGNMLKSEAAGISHKQLLSHDDNNPSCPLCEQNLSASRKRFLKGKFSKQEQFFAHRLQRLGTLIARLKELLVGQHTVIINLRKKIEDADRMQHQATHLAGMLEKIQARVTELTDQHKKTDAECRALEKDMATAQAQLASHAAVEVTGNKEYQAIAQTSAQLEKELVSLGYNAQEHLRAEQRLAYLEQQSSAAEQLHRQQAQQQQRKEQVHEIVMVLKKLKQDLAALREQGKQFEHLGSVHRQLDQREHELTALVKQCTQEKERVLQDKGSLENQRQKLVHLEQEMSIHKKKHDQLAQVIEDYQAIATALSKDGIQALLIEDAIPEIEQEANQLLAKLTDNQAHIFIESLRDLKKGGTKETLDIKISDPIGIRPYELFSGGEAFRIDFALRIAISKLLARRAGTSLQTFIIDEGFGSQDEDGLSHIMDAIYKIQDDFAKIIIVSHLSSMKDQFPVHFVLEKGAQGSVIQVMEQG